MKAMNISLTGTVSKLDIASDTTAPTVDVTWSWAKAADNATPSTDAVEFTEGPQIAMTPQGLITVSNLTASQNYKSLKITAGDGEEWDIEASPVTWDLDRFSQENGGELTVQLSDKWITYLNTAGGTAKATLTLTNGDTKTVTATMATE